MHIRDTLDFRATLADDPVAAEGWLNGIRANIADFPQYDDRWFDHRERELFDAYCERREWTAAKRIVEATQDPVAKAARKLRLVGLSETRYEKI